MRAKNKITAGQFEQYKFKTKYGKLYLRCLEKEFTINKMTVSSIQVQDQRAYPSAVSILTRGYLFSLLFGWLGVIVGARTAKENIIYYVKITFCNGESGYAEIDERIYRILARELFDL